MEARGCLLSTHRGDAFPEVGPQFGEGLELRGLCGELVVELGKDRLLHLLHGDREVERLVLVGVGVVGGELELGTGRRAPEVLVDLGHHRAGTDLVVVVGGGEARDLLALVGPGDVDRDVVAVGRGPLDRLELRELGAHPLQLLVDLVVARGRAGDLHPQAVVARHLDGGPDLDDGVERDPALLLAGGDLDLGRRDHVDVVVDDRPGVVVGQRLPQGLLPTDLVAELGLQQLPGRLAGAEARHPDLLGDAPEGGVDGGVELRLVHLHRQLDLAVVEQLERALDAGGLRIGDAHPLNANGGPHRLDRVQATRGRIPSWPPPTSSAPPGTASAMT